MALLLEYIINNRYIFQSYFLRCCQSSTICNSHILNLKILYSNSYLFLESSETFVTRDLSFDISSNSQHSSCPTPKGLAQMTTYRTVYWHTGLLEKSPQDSLHVVSANGKRILNHEEALGRLPPRSSTRSRDWSSRKLACACSCERVLR